MIITEKPEMETDITESNRGESQERKKLCSDEWGERFKN